MKTADRQKICPNCDGKIAFDVTQCPFCFTTVPAESGIQGSPFKNQNFSETLSSQYAPPYQPKANGLSSSDKKKIFNKASEKPVQEEVSIIEKKEKASLKKTFWPVLLLSLAGNLFTLGVLQFFFAEEGKVQLEMSASYWFLFLVLAAPLFYFGTQMLNKESED